MLAGPDLLVVLGIAFVGIGPKKLPELAKTIGKALAEFKKTTEEIKDSIGIKDLGGIRSSLTGMDLLTDLAEKGESDYKIHKPRVEPHVISEARCLECGESFGTYETKILRPRFRENTCFMRARSWMEGGVIPGLIKKLEY
jgi:TatA/E family protein of Tat protein translocase